MNRLQLVYAPNKIFKEHAIPCGKVDERVRSIADKMLDILYAEGAIGIGANMVGLLERIVVVDLRENGARSPRIFIDPEIIRYSEETQTFEERSLCFPGIAADITRPKSISLTYTDYDGNSQKLEAEGFLATVIQHEVDYLNGKVFLDYLSKLKRDTLLKKMEKYIKINPPHVHGPSCSH